MHRVIEAIGRTLELPGIQPEDAFEFGGPLHQPGNQVVVPDAHVRRFVGQPEPLLADAQGFFHLLGRGDIDHRAGDSRHLCLIITQRLDRDVVGRDPAFGMQTESQKRDPVPMRRTSCATASSRASEASRKSVGHFPALGRLGGRIGDQRGLCVIDPRQPQSASPG